MSNYQITIDMSQATVEGLTENNFNLYGFKAVKTTAKGAPLVWFKTRKYAIQTQLDWQVQYQAYTSTDQIIPNGKITASSSYGIELDNTLLVTGPTGTGSVDTTRGVAKAISIQNQTDNQFTCGISQTQPDGAVAPMCAFNLFGGNLDVIAPIEQVLLMFSSTPVNTGTVIMQAYSRGILVDLTGENQRSVSYDINKGWSWDGGPWARSVEANASLAPLLIQNSASLARKQLEALHRAPGLALVG